MKRRFGVWLNIVTICFCVCAIAIGVYSATTASITASGKIAFTAHNCKIEVTGYIYGHAEGNVHDGLPVTEEHAEYLTTNNTPITIEGTIDIGSRYFSDMESSNGKPENIVFGIIVKNVSPYEITTSTSLEDVELPDQLNVTCSTEGGNLTKDQEITFEYTLEVLPTYDENSNAIFIGFPLLSFDIPINTYKKETKEPFYIIDDDSAYDGYLATKMGHAFSGNQTTEDLEWVAFAVQGDEKNNYIQPSFVAASAVESKKVSARNSCEYWYSLQGSSISLNNYKGHTYWFVQRYVSGGYYFGDDMSSETAGGSVAFGNTIYSNSTAKAYLDNTYITTSITAIADSDLYASITNRSVTETYTGLDYGDGDAEPYDDIYTGSVTLTFSGKLWLLSALETELMPADIRLAYGLGNKKGTYIDSENNGAEWWLRSPWYYNDANHENVNYAGYYDADFVEDSLGIRPAFQIAL